MKRWLITGALILQAGSLAQTEIGNFRYYQEADSIDDSDRSRIITTATDAGLYDNPALIWRCLDQELELIYSPEEFLNIDDPVPVQYRFDSNEPSALEDWNSSTTGTSAFAFEGQVRKFSTQALDAEQVIMRATNYNGVTYTYTFDLEGFDEALSRLECSVSATAPAPTEPAVSTETPQSVTLTSMANTASEAYPIVIKNLEGVTYTEDLNIIRAEGLTIRFQEVGAGESVITLEGSNGQLLNRLEAALDAFGFLNLE